MKKGIVGKLVSGGFVGITIKAASKVLGIDESINETPNLEIHAVDAHTDSTRKITVVMFAEQEHQIDKLNGMRDGDKTVTERVVGNRPTHFAKFCDIYDRQFEAGIKSLDITGKYTDAHVSEWLNNGTAIIKEVEI